MSGAIYCVSVSTLGQGGQSARASAEYIARQGTYARQPDNVLHTESGNMPLWVGAGRRGNRENGAALRYWRAADRYERANGRRAKVIVCALPRALKVPEQIELARSIARELTSGIGDGNLPWTFAIHEGYGSNPHMHLMVSERVNDGIARDEAQWFRRAAVRKDGKLDPAAGGARKTEALKPREWLLAVRATIAVLINRALKAAGFEYRVDHRSNAERGIQRAPQPKLGPRAAALEKKGIRTDIAGRIAAVKATWAKSESPLSPDRSSDRSSAGAPRSVPQNLATLVVGPVLMSAEASLRAHRRLLTGEYESDLKGVFGDRLKISCLHAPGLGAVNSPEEAHRVLDFGDGSRMQDFGGRIEVSAATPERWEKEIVELVTRAKRWSTVRVAGPDDARRAAWFALTAVGVRVEGYESSRSGIEQFRTVAVKSDGLQRIAADAGNVLWGSRTAALLRKSLREAVSSAPRSSSREGETALEVSPSIFAAAPSAPRPAPAVTASKTLCETDTKLGYSGVKPNVSARAPTRDHATAFQCGNALLKGFDEAVQTARRLRAAADAEVIAGPLREGNRDVVSMDDESSIFYDESDASPSPFDR